MRVAIEPLPIGSVLIANHQVDHINALIAHHEKTGRVVSVIPDYHRGVLTLCIVDRLEDKPEGEVVGE